MDDQLRFCSDDPAGDVEHDGPRSLGFDAAAQAAGAAVVEIGDFDHTAAAAAAGEPAVAFGAGKREMTDAEAPDVALGDVTVICRVHFVDAPVVGGKRVGGVLANCESDAGRGIRATWAWRWQRPRHRCRDRRRGPPPTLPACQASVGRSGACSSPASGIGFIAFFVGSTVSSSKPLRMTGCAVGLSSLGRHVRPDFDDHVCSARASNSTYALAASASLVTLRLGLIADNHGYCHRRNTSIGPRSPSQIEL